MGLMGNDYEILGSYDPSLENLVIWYSFLDSFLDLRSTLYPWYQMSPHIHFHPDIALQKNSKQDMNDNLL